MALSIFHCSLLIIALFFSLLSEMNLLLRFSIAGFSLLFLIFSLGRQSKKYWFREWLGSSQQNSLAAYFSFSLFITAGILYFFLPSSGIHLNLSTETKKETFILESSTFRIVPTQIPNALLLHENFNYTLNGTFSTKYPIEKMVFSVSQGSAIWWIDGKRIVENEGDSQDRHLAIFETLEPGWHTIRCEGSSSSLFPMISFETSPHPELDASPIQSAIYPTALSTHTHYLDELILLFCSIGFFLILPLINHNIYKIYSVYQSYPVVFFRATMLIGILLFIGIRIYLQPFLSTSFEADEAAFGIMGNYLLQGQAPPLFHYGQNYQGTIEAFPLSILISFFGSNAFSLHFLPTFFGFIFSFVLVFSIAKYFGKLAGMFSLVPLIIGGSHYHWIF